MKRFAFYILCVSLVIMATSCHTRKKVDENIDKPLTALPLKGKNQLSDNRKRILDCANSWLGVPYKYGGNSKKEGTDCSGMVLQVFLDAGNIKLPRNSAAQAEYCITVDEQDVMPGDLVFFATGKDPNRVSHVGIMIDKNTFIHSSSSKGVCTSKLNTPYYQRTFIMFGRVDGL